MVVQKVNHRQTANGEIKVMCPHCMSWQRLIEGPADYRVNVITGEVFPMFVCMSKEHDRYCEYAGQIRL